MNCREFTVTMRPGLSDYRTNLYGLVPDDFLSSNDGDLLVKVEVLRIVTPYRCEVRLTSGDRFEGAFVSSGVSLASGTISCRVPARHGWDVIALFGIYDGAYTTQKRDSDLHAVVRLTTKLWTEGT